MSYERSGMGISQEEATALIQARIAARKCDQVENGTKTWRVSDPSGDYAMRQRGCVPTGQTRPATRTVCPPIPPHLRSSLQDLIAAQPQTLSGMGRVPIDPYREAIAKWRAENPCRQETATSREWCCPPARMPTVAPVPATPQPTALPQASLPPHPWGDAATIDVARHECQAQGQQLQRADVRAGMSNMGVMQSCCTPSSQSQLLNGDFYCCPDIERMPSGVMAAVQTALRNVMLTVFPAGGATAASTEPAPEAVAQFRDTVRQLCQQSPCDAEVVKLMLTHPLYSRWSFMREAAPICDEAIAQHQAATQGQAAPWYKHPAVLVGGGALAVLVLMRITER